MARFAVYACAFVVIGLMGWVDRTFGRPDLDQIHYHLRYAEGAGVQMGEIFLFTLLAEAALFPLLFAGAAARLHSLLERHWPDGLRRVLGAVPVAAVAGAVAAVLLQFSVLSYAAQYFAPDAFSGAYMDPRQVRIEPPAHRRNLILIYVESLEDGYGNARTFGRDLLAPLRAEGGVGVARYRDAPGTGWTIAGMVATQCGVPLRVYSEYDVKREGDARVFLPGAHCLGDVLRSHGWRNVFLGGAPHSFAGKGAFLRDHGYDEVMGRDEWEAAGLRDDERNEWGLYDEALFARARARLAQLRAAGQPFNLTLLTLDMHNPRGFMSPGCRAQGARDFDGIVACGTRQLAEFVRFVREQGWLEDTLLVVMGDHLAMPNPSYDKLVAAGERTVFNAFYTGAPLPFTRDEALAFDFYPTLLQALGFTIDGGRLGLGYGLFGPPAAVAPAEARRIPLASLSGSSSYRALWSESGGQ